MAEEGFYFSYSYDLTHTLQRLHSGGEQFYGRHLNERAEVGAGGATARVALLMRVARVRRGSCSTGTCRGR